MGKLNTAAYKSERAKELSNLARILKKAQVVQDVKPIEDAAAECMTKKPAGSDNSWGYQIKDLIFLKVEDLGKVRPQALTNSTINISLDVDMAALCVEHDSNSNDCIATLTVNLVLADQSKKHRQSWHFDRHLQDEGDPEPIAAHPIYHFQSGGKHIQGFSDDFFGCTLFVEGPRIAHPPLDGILAIDFVLSNYFGSVWRKLSLEHDYKSLVEGMQKKIWKPYADSFHSTWAPPTGVYEWDPIQILPQIVRQVKSQETDSQRKKTKKKKK